MLSALLSLCLYSANAVMSKCYYTSVILILLNGYITLLHHVLCDIRYYAYVTITVLGQSIHQLITPDTVGCWCLVIIFILKSRVISEHTQFQIRARSLYIFNCINLYLVIDQVNITITVTVWIIAHSLFFFHSGLDKQRPPKPSVPWISRQVWNSACDLSDTLPSFRGIYNDLTKTPCWIQLGENVVCILMYLAKLILYFSHCISRIWNSYVHLKHYVKCRSSLLFLYLQFTYCSIYWFPI